MINSYSIENEDGKIDKYVFLEPINTFDYRIYKYEDGTLSFIFAIMFAIASLFLYIVISLIIYYKIILYIIFGSKNNS